MFTLGSVTLPTPSDFSRDIIETAVERVLLNGVSKKRIVNRKEKYTLKFVNLTMSEANSIISEFDTLAVRSFTVSETSLSIGPVDVFVEIENREYKQGLEYRQDLNLYLLEVT